MTAVIGSDEITIVETSPVVAGETMCVMKNSDYVPDGTVPGFMYFPAYGSGGYNAFNVGFCRELAKRGYIVISGDYGCTPTLIYGNSGIPRWGNDLARSKYSLYKAYLQGTLGAKPGKVGHLYISGGCHLAYSAANIDMSQIFLVAGAIGSCDMEDFRLHDWLNVGYAADLLAAYGGNTAWQAARPTHNPVEIADDLAALGIPQLDYWSSTDPICQPYTHDLLEQRAGAMMTRRPLGPVGHNADGLGMGGFRVMEFVDWIEDQLRAQGVI